MDKILAVLFAVGVVILVAFPAALVIMLAFNGFAPSMFSAPEMTYWQAFAMFVFVRGILPSSS